MSAETARRRTCGGEGAAGGTGHLGNTPNPTLTLVYQLQILVYQGGGVRVTKHVFYEFEGLCVNGYQPRQNLAHS